eukprot:1021055-Prorocentrum_minimum.AAC.2
MDSSARPFRSSARARACGRDIIVTHRERPRLDTPSASLRDRTSLGRPRWASTGPSKGDPGDVGWSTVLLQAGRTLSKELAAAAPRRRCVGGCGAARARHLAKRAAKAGPENRVVGRGHESGGRPSSCMACVTCAKSRRYRESMDEDNLVNLTCQRPTSTRRLGTLRRLHFKRHGGYTSNRWWSDPAGLVICRWPKRGTVVDPTTHNLRILLAVKTQKRVHVYQNKARSKTGRLYTRV